MARIVKALSGVSKQWEVFEQFGDLILATQCQRWQKVVSLVTRIAQIAQRAGRRTGADSLLAGLHLSSMRDLASRDECLAFQCSPRCGGKWPLSGLGPCAAWCAHVIRSRCYWDPGFSIRASAVRALPGPRTGIKRVKKETDYFNDLNRVKKIDAYIPFEFFI